MNVLVELDNFYKRFTGEKFSIGKSYCNRDIYCFKIEKTKSPIIIVQYAIHAREYVTTYLAMRQIKQFVKEARFGTVYFIPAVNPDGIYISLYKKPLYKANARGVDLNVNFDARWGTGKSNKRKVGDSDFIGMHPFSEPETLALRDFTISVKPNATISYHAKGEEIYWQFFQPCKDALRDENYAKRLSNVTGYAVKRTPNSAGGYKDWCIEKLKIPAFTIEVGKDSLSHPIGKKNVKDVYKKNKKVITTLIDLLRG